MTLYTIGHSDHSIPEFFTSFILISTFFFGATVGGVAQTIPLSTTQAKSAPTMIGLNRLPNTKPD